MPAPDSSMKPSHTSSEMPSQTASQIPGPVTLPGTRIVASPTTLDAVVWPANATALRFAPDDVFVIGGESITVIGEHAIVASDAGFVGCWLDADQLAHVTEHIDWTLPPLADRPVLAQGFIAGVPAKLYLAADGGAGTARYALLLTNAAYAHELWERLS